MLFFCRPATNLGSKVLIRFLLNFSTLDDPGTGSDDEEEAEAGGYTSDSEDDDLGTFVQMCNMKKRCACSKFDRHELKRFYLCWCP